VTVVREAAWSTKAQQAGGWTDSFVWYAVAIREMKAMTPRLDEFRPLALDANRLRAKRSPTQADQQRYAQLLNEMRPIIGGWSDPRSLGYQAQVHDSFLPPAFWPKHAGAEVVWHECAHANWFFLPWHRAYLLEFESVARAHVVRLGGPGDWALPYWNSSDYRKILSAESLPLAVQEPELPAGLNLATENGQPDLDRTNPLFEPSRTGPPPLSPPATAADWPDASGALKRHHFANAQDQQTISFGGGYVEDLTLFHFADEIGQLDAQPHGVGHSLTGGLMGAFSTAGLDPVFWLHHANVDRLWETYAKDLGHGYPSRRADRPDPAWSETLTIRGRPGSFGSCARPAPWSRGRPRR
jgi:tyrosinase